MQDLRRNESTAIIDAAAHIRRGLGTARRGRQSLPELRGIQRELLVEWCGKNDCLRTENPVLASSRSQAHGEHTVAYDESTNCWWKSTHPGKCGIGPEFEYQELPPFGILDVSARELLPLEYLDRMILHNQIFGDDVRFEAYIIDKKPSLLVSQPDIQGTPSSSNDMVRSLGKEGYTIIPDIHLGRENSISFYNATRRIAVFDAHPGNFITVDDTAVPIDGIVSKIESEQEHQWLLNRHPL